MRTLGMLAALILVAETASAGLVTNLTMANTASGLGTGDYGTVTVESLSLTEVKFTVDANQTVLSGGTNFGLDRFGFNYDQAATGALTVSLPAGWSTEINPPNQVGEFGLFEQVEQGRGNERQDPLVFTITTENPFASAGAIEAAFYETNLAGHHYAAHIAGFAELGPNQVTSVFVTDGDNPPNVPEPATVLLLGAGLAGLGLIRRKR